MRATRPRVLLAALALASSIQAQSWDSWDRDRDLYSDFLTPTTQRYQGYESRDLDPYRRPAPPVATDPGRAATAAGTGRSVQIQASLPAEKIPWSGVWWPRRRAELAFLNFSQGLSPLEKFDTAALALTGRNPGVALWEADPAHHHNLAPSPTRSDWEGHCNGAAAASMLVREPPARATLQLGPRAVAAALALDDPASIPTGISSYGDRAYRYTPLPGGALDLTSDDIKGWLAETFMVCSTLRFQNPRLLGTRYDRSWVDYQDESFRDIHPHYFHWLLLEFLRGRNQPIVVEVDPHQPVNNHPAYAFEAQGQQRGSTVSFRTKVWMTDYAPSYQFRGTQSMVREYTYDLYTDASGRVTGGQWTGRSVAEHPDFCWIPVGDRRDDGWGRENPQLDPQTLWRALEPVYR